MLQKSTLLILFSLLFSGFLSAQVCTPDPAFTSPGIYPASLADGCMNQTYNAVITVVVPLDTLVAVPGFGNIRVPIDSFVLVNVNNLQAGMNYQCGNSSCVFPGNTSGCILVDGSPTVSGTNTLKVITDVHVTLPIVGAQVIRDSTFTIQFTVAAAPAVATVIADATCGMANGSATVNATGSGPFDFTWNTGLMVNGVTSTLANVASGNYTVTVEGTNGCSVDTILTINDIGGATVDSTQVANVSCNGSDNGTAALFLSGGMAPYTYNWSNMAATSSISNLAPGMYTVTITDAANCVTNTSVTITEPAAISLTLDSQTDILCFGDMNGGGSVSGSGGSGTLAYSWSTGAMINSVNNLPAGMHTAYVTDGNGCMDSVSVTIVEPTQLTSVDGGVNTLTGIMIGRAWVTVSGGTPPYTYLWNNGGTTDTISNLAGGEYTVTIVDGNGCTTLDSAMVNEDPNSIEDEIAAGISSWEVFPNPTAQDVQVRMQLDRMQDVTIDLFDMNGRLIARQSAYTQSWNGSFNLGEQPTGLYLMRVSTQQGMSTRKIVKN